MAKDVAQRELDQAGHRISNVGEPKAEGDATRTDNKSTPKPNAGAGAPGTSFLAAAADHVHPASPGGGGGGATVLTMNDRTEQSGKGEGLLVISEMVIDLSEIVQPRMVVGFAGLTKVTSGAAQFAVQMGGTPGKPDGKVLAGFNASRGEFELDGARSEPLERKVGMTLFKITAEGLSPDVAYSIRSKTITIRGVD